MGPEESSCSGRCRSAPRPTTPDEYEFFIRLVHGGEFTPLLWERSVGDPINIKGAKGDSCSRTTGGAACFVATGTGLAPFMSMIDTLPRPRPEREIWCCSRGELRARPGVARGALELAAGAASGGFPLSTRRPSPVPAKRRLARAHRPRRGDLEGQLDEQRLHAAEHDRSTCAATRRWSARSRRSRRERGFPPEQVRKELYWPKGREH